MPRKFFNIRKLSLSALLAFFLVNSFAAPFIPPVRAEAPKREFIEYERKDLRTENAKVYQIGPNEFRYQESADKIHYGSRGNYREIDSNIIVSPVGEFKYKNAANDFVFRAADTLSNGVRYEGAGKVCEFKLIDTTANSDFNPDAKAAVAGNVLTYKDVFPATNLEFTVENTGVRTEIVTADYSKLKVKYEFEMVSCNQSSFEPPTMEDADSGAQVAQNVQDMDGKRVLTLTPDYRKLGTLKGEVRIDPTINKDANINVFTSEVVPNGHNRRMLAAGNFYDTQNATGPLYYGRTESYLHFDMTLPTGSVITGANLILRRYANGGPGFDASVARLNESITSGTGASTNDWAAKSGAYHTINIDGGDLDFFPYSWNVTTMAQQWRAGTFTNYGMAVYSSNAGFHAGAAFCSSRSDGFCQDQHDPVLVVVYQTNQNPNKPLPNSPANNTEFGGTCDLSTDPSDPDCAAGWPVPLQVINATDPDTIFPATYRGTRFFADNLTFGGTVSSPEQSASGTVNWTKPTNYSDGKYSWYGISYDNMNAQSPPPPLRREYTVDTTAPVNPTGIDLPEYTAGVGIDSTVQVSPTANATTDNISTAVDINYLLEYSKLADFSDPAQVFETVWQVSPAFEVGPKGANAIAGDSDDLTQETIYYFRVKAKDKLGNISNWSNVISTTIDATLPVITSFDATEIRISPNNASSTGYKDSVDFNVGYTEIHPLEARVEIRDQSGTLVRTLAQDITANEGNAGPVNLSFTWDGKNDSDTYLADGMYAVDIIVKDKAGNENIAYTTLDVTIDNNEANINITTPTSGFWFNTDSKEIAGQVKYPNDPSEEDQDLDTFEIMNIDDSIWSTINYATDGTFSVSEQLQLGRNEFMLRTIDTVGNLQEQNLVINRENTAPVIFNVAPTGLSNNALPSITFSVEDPDPTGDGSQRSDLATGVQARGVDIWLTYEILDTTQPQPYPTTTATEMLVEDGDNKEPGLVADVVCSPAAGAIESLKNNRQSADKINCQLDFIANLAPDATYQIHVRSKDNAGNQTLVEGNYLTIDTHNYGELFSPVAGGVYSNSSIKFTGKAAKGNTLVISNTQLGETRSFTLNESLNGTGQDGTFLLSNFTVTCGEYRDIDATPQTPAEEVCSWEVNVLQSYVDADVATANENIVTYVDLAGNTIQIIRNISVNIYSFELLVASDLLYFSPNGDGNQDAIVFAHAANNTTDPSNPPNIATWSLKIKNISDATLREFSGTGYLPGQSFFTGKIESPIGSGNWNWIPDGDYTYELYVKTSDDAEVTTAKQWIYARTSLTDEVIITNPVTGYVTTDGVITVQGQAPPAQIVNNQDGSLRGEVKVTICVDTITNPNDISCDVEETVTAEANGFFSTLVVLPRIDGMNQIPHRITAKAWDDFGNSTQESNVVDVILDTIDPFNYVSITPTLTGVTSPADYERFLNGEIDIDALRAVMFTSNVTENTQAVEMSFAEYVNVVQKPASPSYNYIALINNQVETNPQLNPSGNSEYKYNHNLNITNPAIPTANCSDAAGCNWRYSMPITDSYGGVYEVKFKAKKGETIQELTAGFKVDGTIPAAPYLMIVEKWDSVQNVWVKIPEIDQKYFTNNDKLRLRGGVEPGVELELYSHGQLLNSKTIDNTGRFEFEIDLNTYLINPGSPAMNCSQEDAGACVLADFDFTFKANEYDGSGNLTNSIPGSNGAFVVFDAVLPGAVSISRNTPAPTITGWVQTGFRADYYLKANERLKYADLIKEDGYTSLMTNVAVGIDWSTGISVNRDAEGHYNPVVRLVDLAGNKRDYDAAQWQDYGLGDFRLYVDNTDPDAANIDVVGWGVDDGIKADGVLPEAGRTNPEFVVRSNKVIIKGKAEKTQRVEINLNNKFLTRIDVSATNCELKSENKMAADGLVVKYGEVCDYIYEYVFPDNGKADDGFGTPLNFYKFEARVMDSAANVSGYSAEEIVFHDTLNPISPEIIHTKSQSYSADIVDWHFNGTPASGKYAITKDVEVEVESNAERYSDMEYRINNPQGQQIKYDFFQNPSNRRAVRKYNIGTKSDDRDGCTTIKDTRRIGTCEDGNYKFSLTSTDSPGNISQTRNWQLERDTVRPAKPTARIIADDNNHKISLAVTGEKNSIIVINGRNYNLGDSGALTLLMVGSEDWTYSTTYTFTVKNQDRAGNVGETITVQYTTPPPPVRILGVCTAENGRLAYPFVGQYVVTSEFGPRNLGNGWHSGMDFGTPTGTEILASAKGTVVYRSDDVGAGLGVIVHHPELGVSTLYWHFKTSHVRPYQGVERGAVVGLSNNTGFSTGPHLHFTVRTGGSGTEVNPREWLGDCTNTGSGGDGNTSPSVPRDDTWAIEGASKDNPYAGLDDDDLPWPTIDFDRRFNFLRNDKYNEIKKAEIPAPKITFAETIKTGEAVKVYGVAISKNQPMHVGVNNEFRNNIFTTSWERFYKQDKAQHVRVAIYKEDWTKVDEFWNDDPTGRWSREIPLGGKLKVGDKLMAYVEVYADFSFDGLRWWHDTQDRNPVIFKLSGEKAGGPSNKATVPNIWHDDPAIRAIKNLEARMSNVNKNGDIKSWCGTKIQEYNSITTDNGDKTGSIILYNPEDGNAYFMTGSILWKFKELNGHNCTYPNKTGYPKNNESKAAKSKQGTGGWFQNYAHKTKGWTSIYSSKYGNYYITGDTRDKYESMGGTNNWNYLGFLKNDPKSATSTCDVSGMHQEFEGGKIYASHFGKYAFEYGKFLDQYWNKGEIGGKFGWPISEKRWDNWAHTAEKAEFEQADLRVNYWAITGDVSSVEIQNEKGCKAQQERENDDKHNAPDEVKKAIWDKEDATFKFFARADGYNGEIHPYCGGWIVDYQKIELRSNGKTDSYSWIFYNPTKKTAYYVNSEIGWEYWADDDECKNIAFPNHDMNDIGGKSWGWRTGFGYKQEFQKADIYHYEEPTGVTGEKQHKFRIYDSIRDKYNELGGKGGYLGFPTNQREWQKICTNSGFIQRFDKGELQTHSGFDGVVEIQKALYEGYKDNGGIHSFGFAVNNHYKVNEHATDGYMQDFEKGFLSNKTTDNENEYSFDKFTSDCVKTGDDFFLNYLGDTDNIRTITRDSLVATGHYGSETYAYKSLQTWHDDGWVKDKVGADFWHPGKVDVDKPTRVEKIVLEQLYYKAIWDEKEAQYEDLTKMTTRLGIMQQDGWETDSYWEKYFNYIVVDWEEEERLTNKSAEIYKHVFNDGTILFKSDYRLTRNRYLIDNVNNDLQFKTLITTIKFLFSAAGGNFDKAGEGFKDAVGECVVDTVKTLWPPEWVNAGYQLGEFLYNAPEFFENLDLIIYYGTQSIEGKEYTEEEARAYSFGKGVGVIVCMTAEIWIGKVAGSLGKVGKLKSISKILKAEGVFDNIASLGQKLKSISRVDDMIDTFKAANYMPDNVVFRMKKWWYMKNGYGGIATKMDDLVNFRGVTEFGNQSLKYPDVTDDLLRVNQNQFYSKYSSYDLTVHTDALGEFGGYASQKRLNINRSAPGYIKEYHGLDDLVDIKLPDDFPGRKGHTNLTDYEFKGSKGSYTDFENPEKIQKLLSERVSGARQGTNDYALEIATAKIKDTSAPIPTRDLYGRIFDMEGNINHVLVVTDPLNKKVGIFNAETGKLYKVYDLFE